jgi:RimJ/RimL family protein N-acetyltransferase
MKIINLESLSYIHIQNTFQWLKSSQTLRDLIDCIEIPNEKNHLKIWNKRLKDSTRRDFAIIYSPKKHIGNCGLINIDFRRKKADLYIYLYEEPKKKTGSTVLLKILELVFDDMKLNKLSVFVLSNNLKALFFFKSKGFEQEGIHRDHSVHNNFAVDAISLSMLRIEYQKLFKN